MAAGYIVTVNNQSAVSCLVDCITATDTINNSTASVPIASLESITFIINSAATGYVIKGRGSGFSSTIAAADVAAHATTSNIWVAREITLTGGAVTFTDIADAPYVGAVAWVKQNAAHVWTDGAVFEVQGNANYTAAASDWLRVQATTVSTFNVTIFKADAVAGAAASDTAVGVIEIAVQSEQETGSSTTLAVTPGRQQFHPSASKAWCFVDRSAGTPTLGALDYGVASVTDDGAGQTIVTFDTAMSGTTYIPLTSATNNSASVNILPIWHTRATGSVKVLTMTGGAVTVDDANFAIGIFGDQ